MVNALYKQAGHCFGLLVPSIYSGEVGNAREMMIQRLTIGNDK